MACSSQMWDLDLNLYTGCIAGHKRALGKEEVIKRRKRVPECMCNKKSDLSGGERGSARGGEGRLEEGIEGAGG